MEVDENNYSEKLYPFVVLKQLTDDTELQLNENDKIGEIYRTNVNHYSFVCCHCGVHFPLYIQFVAHIDEHFRQFQAQVDPVASVKLEKASDSDGDKADISVLAIDLDNNDADGNKHDTVWFNNDGVWDDEVEARPPPPSTGNHQVNVPTNDAPQIKCDICDQCFKSPKYLRRHKKIHDKTAGGDCPICGRKFALGYYITAHMKSAHKDYNEFTCDKCDAKFHFLSQLQSHQKRHRDTSPVLQRSYECHRCHETFDKLPQCYHHMQQKHWNIESNKVECRNCNAWFKSKDYMKKHLKICTMDPSSQYQCQVCHIKFKYKRQLHEHRRTAHLPSDVSDRIYKCKVCKKEFTTYNLKSQHMRSHRAEELRAANRLLKCAHCTKEFAIAADYRKHLATHDQGATFKCDICQKTLRLSYKNRHLERHRNEKRYQCAECGKQFKASSDMSVHARMHKSNRQHHCELCPKFYRTVAALQMHMESHTGEYRFPCEICKQGFSWRGSLKRHMLAVHKQSLENYNANGRFSALTTDASFDG